MSTAQFVTLYIRASVHLIAVRLARTTLLLNSYAVPRVEQWLCEGYTLRQAETMLRWPSYAHLVRRGEI